MVALSNAWDHPDVQCLAQGLWKNEHVYAGCVGAMYETGFVAGPAFLEWRSIPLPPKVTQVTAIAVDKAANRTIIATDEGVFWAPSGYPYQWRIALLAGRIVNTDLTQSISSLAVGTNIIAAPSNGSDPFVGTWQSIGATPELLFENRPIPPLNGNSQFWQVSVATCQNMLHVCYALCFDNEGKIAGVMKCLDSGQTWSWCSDSIMSTSSTLSSSGGDSSSGGWLKRVHASANGKSVSCCGLVGFISEDMGGSWRILQGAIRDVPHADVHVVYFDPNDPAGQRLIMATDGGIFIADGLGRDPARITGMFNRFLNTLQCMSHGPTRGFWGAIAAGATSANGYAVFSAQQDNGVIRTRADTAARWKRVRGGDGTFVGLLPGGSLVTSVIGSDIYAVLHRENALWDAESDIPLANGDPKGLREINAQTLVRPWKGPPTNGTQEFVYAVVAVEYMPNIYALVGTVAPLKLRWVSIAALPIQIGRGKDRVSALDGERGIIYVGTAQGRLFAISLTDFPPDHAATVHEFNVAIAPAQLGVWSRLLSETNSVRWAIMESDAGSRVLFQQSLVWKDVTANLVAEGPAAGVGPKLYGLCVDAGNAYVASDNRVYCSRDEGTSWVDFSGGLPERFHGSDLVISATDNGRNLLLATFGRAVWTTPLEP